MTNTEDRQHHSLLQRIARRAMMERVLLPDLSVHVIAELNGIRRAATNVKESTRDFRNLAWCSIDNDDSLDLDHLTVAEVMPEGAVEILIAVAKETTS